MMQGDDVEYALDKYADMVYRIAVHNLKNKADAEDAVQNVFVKLIESNLDINDAKHLKHWLIRVAINICKNHHKSAWFQKRIPLDDSLSHDNPLSPADSGTEEVIDLMEALWSLRPKQRNLIYLYYYEGYTVPEISSIMKMNPKTVYTQLNRARQKLKNIILEEGEGR